MVQTIVVEVASVDQMIVAEDQAVLQATVTFITQANVTGFSMEGSHGHRPEHLVNEKEVIWLQSLTDKQMPS